MGTWNYVVNPQFVEAYGSDAIAKIVAVLEAAAAKAGTANRDELTRFIGDGLEAKGLELPAKSIDQLAENLTFVEHDRVAVSDDAGHVHGEFPIAGRSQDAGQQHGEHIAPDDEGRPAYS